MNKKPLLQRTIACLAAGSLLGVSTSLWADQERSSGFYIAPSIGAIFPDSDRQLEDDFSATLGLGYQFSNPWSLELSYLTSELDNEGSSNTTDYTQYRLDALYDFTTSGKLTPYGVLGFGDGKVDHSWYENNDTFANVGVGIKYALNNALSLRSDVRAFKFTEADATDIGLNFGISYLFGAKSTTKSTTPTVRKETDSDKDGVTDSKDQCPGTPTGTQVNQYGCTVNNDLDNDGVPNNQDACPDTKAGAKVTDNGCYATLEKDVSISLNITFENNSDAVRAGSNNQISAVAEFMKTYPNTNVVINGYTDSMGAESYNKALSQRRANKVAEILTSQYGIEADRIEAIGYGEANPIASNDTAEGRAKNRRVDAVVKATKIIIQE